jgi:hypothetical protein
MRTALLSLAILRPILAGVAPAATIDAGVGVVEITPPRGYRMAGYFAERLNTGTRDPLFAKALVFRQGDQQAALVFCDLVGIPRSVAARARVEASRLTGIPAARIAVAATHSHTGPLYYGVLRTKFHEKALAEHGKDDPESVDYPAVLVSKIGEAVASAQKSLAPVRLDAGVARESGLSFNRRFHMKDGTVRFNPGPLNPDIVRPAGPIDPDVGIILLRPEAGGPPLAGLTVFALHLDTVGGTEYSADYPVFLQDELQTAFGPGFVSVFGAGTCGDINHIDVTRRERASTETLGRTLARTMLQEVKSLETVKEPALSVAMEVVNVPLQRPDPEVVAEARKVFASFETTKTPFLETVRVSKVVDLADNYARENEPLEVQVFRLGTELALVTLPGEIFVEHGLAIKKASPFKTTLVVELTNASPNYVPTLKAVAEGSYEVVNSRVAPGGGEMLVEAALRLLNRVHKLSPAR